MENEIPISPILEKCIQKAKKLIIDGKEVLIVDLNREKRNKAQNDYYHKNKDKVLAIQYAGKKKKLEDPEYRAKWNEYQKIYQAKYREAKKLQKNQEQNKNE